MATKDNMVRNFLMAAGLTLALLFTGITTSEAAMATSTSTQQTSVKTEKAKQYTDATNIRVVSAVDPRAYNQEVSMDSNVITPYNQPAMVLRIFDSGNGEQIQMLQVANVRRAEEILRSSHNGDKFISADVYSENMFQVAVGNLNNASVGKKKGSKYALRGLKGNEMAPTTAEAVKSMLPKNLKQLVAFQVEQQNFSIQSLDGRSEFQKGVEAFNNTVSGLRILKDITTGDFWSGWFN